jgi:hypothetical protein
MTEASVLGSEAEYFAASMLRDRGFAVTSFKTNNPTYDLEVNGCTSFMISVKASKNKQHVRLGSLRSVNRLTKGHFVFAFMPALGAPTIKFSEDGFRLLIIPAEIAREDSIAVRNSYLELKGYDEGYSYSLIVKGYARRAHQSDTWRKWSQFENAWSLLPLAQNAQSDP